MKPTIALIVTVLSTPSVLPAQKASLPPLLAAGLVAYRSSGVQAAMDTWMKDSPVGPEDAARINAVDLLKKIEQVYGHMVGYDALLVTPIGHHVSRAYVMVLFERGPVYMWFDVYTLGGKDVVTSFLFNTKPDTILPPSLLSAVEPTH